MKGSVRWRDAKEGQIKITMTAKNDESKHAVDLMKGERKNINIFALKAVKREAT
jgi:hypothetical protein